MSCKEIKVKTKIRQQHSPSPPCSPRGCCIAQEEAPEFCLGRLLSPITFVPLVVNLNGNSHCLLKETFRVLCVFPNRSKWPMIELVKCKSTSFVNLAYPEQGI